MNSGISSQLEQAFMRFCQGDFGYRMPRTLKRDEQDTQAFFFNSVADELERTIQESREQQRRLAKMTDTLSDTLMKVASGDFEVQAERDFRGDSIDVLVFLVNNTISELAHLVAERERRNAEEKERLNQLVAERTAQLRESEENFRQLFDASPVALVLSKLSDNTIVAANSQAATLFNVEQSDLVGQKPEFWVNLAERERLFERVRTEGMVDGFETQLKRFGGDPFWCDMAVRLVHIVGERGVLSGTRDITDRKRLEEQLRELATTDSLTGALSRRRLLEIAEAELERAARYKHPLSIAMLDLDHFKTVNDTFGHAVGDEALRSVAATIRQALRKQDCVGRYGGEELTVIFPETEANDACAVGERIRAAVASLGLSNQGRDVPITISAGVASWRVGESLADTLKRADEALYQAKSSGRNKVLLAVS